MRKTTEACERIRDRAGSDAPGPRSPESEIGGASAIGLIASAVDAAEPVRWQKPRV